MLLAKIRAQSTYILIAVVATLVIAGLSCLIVWNSYQGVQAQAEVAILNTARTIATQVEAEFLEIDALLKATGQRYTYHRMRGRPAEVENLRDRLSIELLDHPLVLRVGIANAEGEVVFNTGIHEAFAARPNIARRDYFINARAGVDALQFAGPVEAKLDGRRALVLSRRLVDDGGAFAGVIFAVIPTEALGQSFSKIELGTHGVIGMRTDDFSPVVRYPNLAAKEDTADEEAEMAQAANILHVQIADHFFSTVTRPAEGIERLACYLRFPHAPYWLSISRATDDIAGKWKTTAAMLALLTLSIGGLLLVWAHRLAEHVSQLNRRVEERTWALAESEETFRRFFDGAPDAYMVMDVKEARIETCNRSAEMTLGRRRQDILGKTPVELSPLMQPDGRSSAASVPEKIVWALDKGSHRFEWLFCRPEGEVFWAEVTISVGSYQHRKVLYVAWRDISDRKSAEQELEKYRTRLELMVDKRTADLQVAKEAAEAASRAKTAFLSMASHELRTPMNGVMGAVALALRRASEPQLIDYLQKADRASRQLLTIINDVLEISRIEANRLTLGQVRFSLGEVRTQVLDALETIAGEKGVELLYPPDPMLEGQMFIGDPPRLTQILVNLVGNAIKFTPAGSVSVKIVERPCRTPGKACLRFEILDTGIGICPADFKRIFEPFEQVDSSLSRPFGGTGLGLALCRKLVEAMRGRIGVDSELGQGSLFWFEIELEPVVRLPALPEGSDSAGDGLMARHRGANILLVEDDPLSQEVVSALLESVGLNVFTASDGLEAVECARSGGFDMILMDMNMPKMNGIEATCEIRRIPAHAETPIVALSANAFVEDRHACIEAGMNDHMGKPVSPETLYETVLRWLDLKGR